MEWRDKLANKALWRLDTIDGKQGCINAKTSLIAYISKRATATAAHAVRIYSL